MDLAYRRAKAAKSVEKLVKAGKIGPQKKNKGKVSEPKSKSRKNETEELFQGDFGEDKKRKGSKNVPPKKPSRAPGVSKRAFKSKSRYVMLSKLTSYSSFFNGDFFPISLACCIQICWHFWVQCCVEMLLGISA